MANVRIFDDVEIKRLEVVSGGYFRTNGVYNRAIFHGDFGGYGEFWTMRINPYSRLVAVYGDAPGDVVDMYVVQNGDDIWSESTTFVRLDFIRQFLLFFDGEIGNRNRWTEFEKLFEELRIDGNWKDYMELAYNFLEEIYNPQCPDSESQLLEYLVNGYF